MIFGNCLTGTFGTSLTNAPAPLYCAQLGMKIAPNVSLIGSPATVDSGRGTPNNTSHTTHDTRHTTHDARHTTRNTQLGCPMQA